MRVEIVLKLECPQEKMLLHKVSGLVVSALNRFDDVYLQGPQERFPPREISEGYHSTMGRRLLARTREVAPAQSTGSIADGKSLGCV